MGNEYIAAEPMLLFLTEKFHIKYGPAEFIFHVKVARIGNLSHFER